MRPSINTTQINPWIEEQMILICAASSVEVLSEPLGWCTATVPPKHLLATTHSSKHNINNSIDQRYNQTICHKVHMRQLTVIVTLDLYWPSLDYFRHWPSPIY